MQQLQMNNLDYFYLARELQGLESAFFNKVYELSEGKLRFKFHRKAEFNLICELGVRIHISKFTSEGGEPSNFVLQLRKHLENARIVAIRQLNFDRLLQIEFEKGETFFLTFEMFGKGNLVLSNSEGIIIGVYKKEEYAGRALKQREKYILPPIEKKLPSDFAVSDFTGAKGKVVASLSKLVNLSPQILDELVLRSKVDRDKDISSLSDPEKGAIVLQLHSLLDFFAPTIYLEEKDGKKEMVAFSSILLEKFSGLEKMNFESLSEALDKFYSSGGHQGSAKSKKFDEAKKLEFQLAGQEKAETGFLSVEKESREKGRKILENFEQVEKLISEVKRLKKEGKTKEEIMELLKLSSISNEEIELEI